MCRHFAPALVLSLLDPKLSWDEAEVQASVEQGVEVIRADGSPLSPYDLKRLQVRCLLPGSCSCSAYCLRGTCVEMCLRVMHSQGWHYLVIKD